ncbi:hypothetical protein ACJRO7_026884 [Eucalyptus globulus]|uniref:AMP-dependent synthetase/ligase domain-containing protein n=1 Tax=Eucalyptus globulus TaxID=34317 RepID=A0ABD3JPA9_EUCGL
MGELTLTDLLKKATSDFPNERAVSACEELNLTHMRLQELVNRATALITASHRHRRAHFPQQHQGMSFVILFPAVIHCRATAAPLNPFYTAKVLEFYLSDSEPKLLLTLQEGNRRAQSAASRLNIPHLTANLHSADTKITLFDQRRAEPSLDSMSTVVNDPSNVAMFLHTSGAMGHPSPITCC